jgi:hypothetical protein
MVYMDDSSGEAFCLSEVNAFDVAFFGMVIIPANNITPGCIGLLDNVIIHNHSALSILRICGLVIRHKWWSLLLSVKFT